MFGPVFVTICVQQFLPMSRMRGGRRDIAPERLDEGRRHGRALPCRNRETREWISGNGIQLVRFKKNFKKCIEAVNQTLGLFQPLPD